MKIKKCDASFQVIYETKIMKTILIIILTSSLLTYSFGYDLPEVIAVIEGEAYFACDFCNVSDLSNDGCDELFVYQPNTENDPYGRYNLYLGGEDFGVDPDFVFSSDIENAKVRDQVVLLQNPGPNHGPIVSMRYYNPQTTISYLRSFEYQNGEFNQIPFFAIDRIANGNAIYPLGGPVVYPFDMNGDGWSDLISYSRFAGHGYLHLYTGGADFDTIPDWSLFSNNGPGRIGSLGIATGCDINSDGFDDILVPFPDGEFLWYEIYLGSSPIDTIPASRIRSTGIEGRNSPRELKTFSMLPDVNGDGYDDWAVYWIKRTDGFDDYDGVFVFFGGEEPDWEPDIELEGHRFALVGEGQVSGGDLNDDGYGDIVCSFFRNPPRKSEFHIHFGSRWMDGEADIVMDMRRDYNGEFNLSGRSIGAVGDYNGDGVNDFISSAPAKALIFAGSRDWHVGVNEETHIPKTSTIINAYPNPFNQNVKLTFNTNPIQTLNVQIYDVNARLVEMLFEDQTLKTKYETSWTAPESGLYFIVAETGSTVEISKILCIR